MCICTENEDIFLNFKKTVDQIVYVLKVIVTTQQLQKQFNLRINTKNASLCNRIIKLLYMWFNNLLHNSSDPEGAISVRSASLASGTLFVS